MIVDNWTYSTADTFNESQSESERALCITEKEERSIDAHTNKYAEKKPEWCKERKNKKRTHKGRIGSISHCWVCVSSWDSPVKRKIFAIVAVLLQYKQFIMFRSWQIGYHRKPQAVFFHIQKYEIWFSVVYCYSNTWNLSALWGTEWLQKENVNGLILLFWRCGLTSTQEV